MGGGAHDRMTSSAMPGATLGRGVTADVTGGQGPYGGDPQSPRSLGSSGRGRFIAAGPAENENDDTGRDTLGELPGGIGNFEDTGTLTGSSIWFLDVGDPRGGKFSMSATGQLRRRQRGVRCRRHRRTVVHADSCPANASQLSSRCGQLRCKQPPAMQRCLHSGRGSWHRGSRVMNSTDVVHHRLPMFVW